MANVVNLEAVSKSFGAHPLLSRVSLGIDDADRIGVVGVNGGGKTTLLEVLAGLEPPDDGRVSQAKGLRLGVVTQRTELLPGATVRESVLDPLGFGAEHEWAGDPRIRGVLDGMTIGNGQGRGTGNRQGRALGLERPVDTLSGGERRRVALAAALVRELDLLVLDEPTNHLDVEGVRWLAEHLVTRRCAVVVVTHDRWFLDTVCTRTWEVVAGSRQPPRTGGATWPARSWPGCAAGRRRGRPSRVTASRPPKLSSRTCPRRATRSSCSRSPATGSAGSCWSWRTSPSR